MRQEDRLIQRLRDGELGAAEAAGLERLVRDDPVLRIRAERLEQLDDLLRARTLYQRASAQAASGGRRGDAGLVAAVMARVPAAPPRRQIHLSIGHVAVVAIAGIVIAAGWCLRDPMRDLLPVGTIAAVGALLGLALFVAAKPLLAIEASLVARMLRKRIPVGDGDVLVCRVLGVALVIGAVHIVMA